MEKDVEKDIEKLQEITGEPRAEAIRYALAFALQERPSEFRNFVERVKNFAKYFTG